MHLQAEELFQGIIAGNLPGPAGRFKTRGLGITTGRKRRIEKLPNQPVAHRTPRPKDVLAESRAIGNPMAVAYFYGTTCPFQWVYVGTTLASTFRARDEWIIDNGQLITKIRTGDGTNLSGAIHFALSILRYPFCVFHFPLFT
jgi:hypothetical protein